MKKLIAITCMAILSALSAASAQDVVSPNNPNNSSFPESSARDVAPNEPDHNYGSSSSTYKLPSGTSPTAGTTSNPQAPLPADTDNGGMSSDMDKH